MTYVKTKGALGAFDRKRFIGKSKISAASKQRASGGGVATAQSIAFAKTKAEWPRCNYTITDHRTTPSTKVTKTGGYLYKFKSGSKLCSIGWNQDAYAMVVKGESPKKRPINLDGVTKGSPEYNTFLCKAQGDGGKDPEVQAIRVAFDQKGWEWVPTINKKLGRWRHYGGAPKPPVYPQNLSACSRHLAELNATALDPNSKDDDIYWRGRAYWFSRDEKLNRKAGAVDTTRHHRSTDCDDPNNEIPLELREACKAAMAKNDGTSVQSFKKQIKDMSEREMEDLIYGGAGAGAALPPPPGGLLSSVPPLYLYGGAAAAVVLIAALAVRKKKA